MVNHSGYEGIGVGANGKMAKCVLVRPDAVEHGATTLETANGERKRSQDARRETAEATIFRPNIG